MLVEQRTLGFDDFLREEHHHQYGRPWCIGRSYFDYLVEIGLNTDHRVLDVGCGAGRVGIWLIGFLNTDRYFGVDSHLDSLTAFSEYEIPLNALANKRPRLSHNADFNFVEFGERFDFILDFYVSLHLTPDLAFLLYSNIVSVLAPQGRIVLPYPPPLSSSQLNELGLAVRRVETRPTFLLARSSRDFIKEEQFHVLQISSG